MATFFRWVLFLACFPFLAATAETLPVPSKTAPALPPAVSTGRVQGVPAAVPAVAQQAVAPKTAPTTTPTAAAPVIKPYRTFVTIQRYVVDSLDAGQTVGNVRLELFFPTAEEKKQTKLNLPENSDFWPIGNGQMQEVNRTYEIPWAYIQRDGFNFAVQMIRKGTKFMPCKFEVTQLSQFNRQYVCHTDVSWQVAQHIPEDQVNREGIQVRVFTDMNSKPNEIPKDALALK